MSMRRTRQELIEQGVLKEVPETGKTDCCRDYVIHLISLYMTVVAPELSHPHI